MALTEIYVDPGLNSDTGAGTIGDPYGDLEYAFETATQDTTNGNRVNVKSGTAEALAAVINTALTAGTWSPSNTAPLIIQGYTSAAGDGGRATIDLTATGNFITSIAGVGLYDIDFTNGSGATDIIVLSNYSEVVNCSIQNTGASRYINIGSTRGCVFGNYLYGPNTGANAIVSNQLSTCYNYIEYGGSSTAVSCNSDGIALRNIIVLSHVSASGIQCIYGSHAINNSIYQSAAGTGAGIVMSTNSGPVINNLIEGFSGTGGDGIRAVGLVPSAIIGGNAFYNCDTAIDSAANIIKGTNETLSASPFTNAAAGDFSPVDTGSVKEGSQPSAVAFGQV